MDNATPIDFSATWTAQAITIDATWDYWATVEATDLTQIAGEQSAFETEIALPPAPDTTVVAAGQSATIQPVSMAVQLPNTGSGQPGYTDTALLIVLTVAVLIAVVAMRMRAGD